MEKKTHSTVPGFEPGSFDSQSRLEQSNFFPQKDLKFIKNRKITFAFQIQFKDELDR